VDVDHNRDKSGTADENLLFIIVLSDKIRKNPLAFFEIKIRVQKEYLFVGTKIITGLSTLKWN